MKTEKPIKLFLAYAGHHKKAFVILTFVYVMATVLLVLAPQTLSRFIDIVQTGGLTFGPDEDLWRSVVLAILLYLAAMLAQSVMAALLEYQLASIGLRFTDDFRNDLMSHFLSLDAKRLTGITSGEMLTRLNDDVKGLFQYYYILFYKLTGSGLALAGILAALWLRVSWLSALLLLVSLFAVFLFKIIQDRGIPKYVRQAKAAASFNSLVKEFLDNAPSLRGLRAESYADKFHAAMKHRYCESFPAGLMYANLWSASTVVEALIIGTGLFLSLYFWDRGSITVGTVYLIYTYSQLVITPLQDFRNYMGNMQGAKAGIVRSREFLGMRPDVTGGSQLLRVGNAISLAIENLHFLYKNETPVLNGINLRVQAGGHIGIMGETGCGKSTLFSLIAGFNGYEKGSIRLDDTELRGIDSKNLRKNVVYCTQKVQLIHGSIRDNITFYDGSYSESEIMKAVDLLGLTEWFAKFPNGLDTRLEMGEGNLSSGEAQLLALVRLSLRQPGLVLLDEISSNLDAVTEKRITAAVKKMCQGRTVIAIAHNREALGLMDAVLRMENGVLTSGGEYAR